MMQRALLAWGSSLLLGVLALVRPALTAPLLVIVAPQRAAVQIDRAELALIFQRKRLYWPGGGRIQPVNLPARHPLRLRFSQAVLGASPDSLDRYWSEQYFHGVRPPYVAPSVAAMLRFVADTPSAIGYVEDCLPRTGPQVAVVAVIDDNGRFRLTRQAPQCQDGPAGR